MTIEENLALAECRCKGRTLGIGVNRKKREQYRELLSLLGLGLKGSSVRPRRPSIRRAAPVPDFAHGEPGSAEALAPR